MARPLRIDVRNGWYHVCSRGIEQRRIFVDAGYYRHFLELLEGMCERYGVEVHAYCMMLNHYHLIIRTPAANASRAIQWLNVSYAAWFNAKQQRVGHVFQGRFQSVLIDDNGAWVLQASEYLHLNPVRTKLLGLGKRDAKAERAGISIPAEEEIRRRVERLRKFKWSSYRFYAGLAIKPQWLHTEEIHQRSGGKEKYRRAVEGILACRADPGRYECLRGRLAIGRTEFIERVKRLVGKVTREQPERKLIRHLVLFDEVVKLVEKEKGEPWNAFCDRQGDWGRDAVLYLVRMRSGLTFNEISEKVRGLNYKAAEKAVARFKQRMVRDTEMSRLVKGWLAQMSDVGT